MRHEDSEDGKGLSLRDEQKRLTRRLLIEGALTAFERKGYAATTIEDIVAEANASRATFYLHFKSKADVVLVVTQTLGRRWRELYVELTSGERLSRDELYAWLDAMVGNYETNRASLDAMNQAVAIEPEVAEVRLASIRETIAVMAQSIQRWSGGDEEDARIRAALLLAQMDRFFDLWVIRGLAFDRERALATLTDQWLAVLGAGARKRTPRETVELLARQLACSLDTLYSQAMGAPAAIAGLGITEMGKVYGRTPSDFAGEAIALALEDAGLEARDVDGLLINANHSARDGADAAVLARVRGSHAAQRDERLRVDRRVDAAVRGACDRSRARRTWWCACTPTPR